MRWLIVVVMRGKKTWRRNHRTLWEILELNSHNKAKTIHPSCLPHVCDAVYSRYFPLGTTTNVIHQVTATLPSNGPHSEKLKLYHALITRGRLKRRSDSRGQKFSGGGYYQASLPKDPDRQVPGLFQGSIEGATTGGNAYFLNHFKRP